MKRLLVIFGLAAACSGLVWHADRFDFIGDDAYISFRYAENLAHHGELTWNAGEGRVEGYTNFLWTVLLALGIRLGVRPEHSALPLSALFAVLAACTLFWLCRILAGATEVDQTVDARGRSRFPPWYRELFGGKVEPSGWDLLGPGLLACWGAYACWASGGMETQLFTFLCLLAITQYVREEIRAPRFRPSAIWFALAAMTRPEGALIFAVVGAHRLLWTIGHLIRLAVRRDPFTRQQLDQRLQQDGLWVILFLVLYGGYFLWRYEYYGYVYPNTYYIKIATTNAAKTRAMGAAYLESFVRDYRLWWLSPALVLGLAAGALWGRRGVWRVAFVWTLILPVLAIYTRHIVRFGGDFMAMHRFFVPLIPLLALLVVLACRAVVDLPLGRLLPAPLRFWTFAPVAIGLLALFASRSTGLDRRTLRTLRISATGYTGSYDNMESVAFMKKFARDRVLVGRWLRRRVPPGALMAVGGAGAIVYSSGLRAIDSFGLSEVWVAHHARAISHRPGHQKRAPLHRYVLKRRPDILCYPGLVKLQNWEYRPSKAERRRWDRRGYRYFCATPRGLYPSHYCCLMRTDKYLGLTEVSAYENP